MKKKEKVYKNTHYENKGNVQERHHKEQSNQNSSELYTAKQGEEFFLNPYNFVDVSSPTPRYKFTTNDKFHKNRNSGYIDVVLKTITPLFIQDPKETEMTKVKLEEGEKKEHKKMGFFKLNDEPAIPSTSLKGAFRSRIETLSNSCFPYDYCKNEILNYMSYRLDVTKDSKVIRTLQPGILKEVKNKWFFLELDVVKVLTVVDRYMGNCDDESHYEKAIYFAKSMNGVIEKISIKARTGGINDYINRKKDSRAFETPRQVDDLKTGTFRIEEVNGQEISQEMNNFNKTFPYINLRQDYGLSPVFYGIVRKKKESWGDLFKLKEISTDLTSMKRRLKEYSNLNINADRHGGKYAVCQMLLKTSFDIETKTQDQLFFVFGEENLLEYVAKELKHGRGAELDESHIQRLKSVLAQRYENLKQRYKGDYLFKIQPTSKQVKDGMLVYHNNEDNNYLTYTQVARKPFTYGIAEILGNKAVCKNEAQLCPTCNMFGGVNIKSASNTNGDKTISIGGKISFSFGKCLSNGGFETKTLKPLGEPKPSFYQFYVLDNRKDESEKCKDKTNNYDFLDIKLGRKVYLKHNLDLLDYSTEKKTNLNSTVQLLKAGATFNFRINYFNLSHYELGLLLFSLNLKYKGKRLNIQLGMGKPLGLGRMEIAGIEAKQINRKQRYSSLKNNGVSKMSQEDMEKYINIFQRCQVYLSKSVPMDNIKLNDETIDNYQVKEPHGFEDLVYIKEFLLLNSINDGIPLKYPIKYPSKKEKQTDKVDEMKGFKWFIDEKKNMNQRLFDPLMLEKIDDETVEKNIPLYNWGQVSANKEKGE